MTPQATVHLARPVPQRDAGEDDGVARPAEPAGARVPWGRLGLALGAWVTALAYSMWSLAAAFTYQSPVGELLLVPPLAAALVVMAAVRHRHAWAGRLGHGDYLLGGALLAGGAGLVASGRFDEFNLYWVTRPDLLAAPLVLGGFLVLLLGMRALVVCAYGVAMAAAAWPYPFTLLSHYLLDPLTDATFFLGGFGADALGFAERVQGADNVLRIANPAGTFEIMVSSACAGLNSLVGYAMVAGVALYMIDGPLRRRALWLGSGIVAVWAAAVVRIVLIAMTGRFFGPAVAIDILHPVASMVLDAAVFAAAIAVLGRFGLRWKPWQPRVHSSLPPGHYEVPVPGRRLVRARIGLVVLVTFGLLALNQNLAASSMRQDFVGNVPAAPLTTSVLGRAGVGAEFEQRLDWSRRFFGEGSQWNRYRLTSAAGSTTVWVDSIAVDDPQSLRTHGVVACYRFHDAEVLLDQSVRLDGRLAATALVVRHPTGEVWHTVFWQWPVLAEGRLRYERVILLASSVAPGGDLAGDPNPELTASMVQDANRIVREATAVEETAHA